MKIPQVFLPEKSLDYKVNELSKDGTKTKKPFEESYFYNTVYSNLKCHLHTLNKGPVRVFWISDKHKESKYEELENMIDEMIEKSNVKLTYEIHDYYRKEFGKADIVKIWYNNDFSNQVQIVYVDHKTTEILRRGDDYKESLPLFDRCFVVTV